MANLLARVMRRTCFMAMSGVAMMYSSVVMAAEGAPKPWGIGMLPGASPVRTMMDEFHNYYLVPMMFGISALILGLLIYLVVRFNRRANPTPARFAHNTTIEVIWTALPIIILMIIAIPSMRLLYFGDKVAKPDLTVKVTGHQWYWSYEYPDHGNFSFDARPIWESSAVTEAQSAALLKDAMPNWLIPTEKPLRLLETDNRLVVPVGANVRVLLAGADVIHSWYVPALGTQKAAVPGRLNETWLKADREGVYYGQCTQICGIGHGFMPIVIEAVTPERFEAWAKSKQPAGAEPASAAPATP